MRKKLTVILALILTLALALPAVSFAEDGEYTFNAEKGIIEGYNGTAAELVLPDAIDGVPVQGFKDWFLNYNADIKSLTLPDGIKAINYFGSDMENLEKVTLPKDLKYIGSGCFQSVGSLKEITIPAGVRFIGEFFVTYAYSLESVTFEGVCPAIMESFHRMPSTTKIYVPDDQLEAYTEALEAIGCAGEIVPSGKNAVIDEPQFVREDFDFDAATGTVTAYKGHDAVVEIPAEIDGVQVRAIGKEAFRNNYDVWYVSLPEGLETIGVDAFRNARIEYAVFPSTLRTIEKGAFYSGYPGCRLVLPEGLETIGEEAFLCCGIDGSLVLPEGLKKIGASAFNGNLVFEEVYFPASLEEIGEKAFFNCMFNYACFEGYDVPAIGADAFGGYTLEALVDIDTPWDISREKWEAYKAVFEPMGFENLTVWRNNPISALDLTYIPAEDYDENAFVAGYSGSAKDLTAFSGIWHGDELVSVTGIAAGAFKGNQQIRSFYPHHCEWFASIGDEAFADSSLEYIELFDSITSIGAGAFRNCTNLTELILPAYLTEIGEGAFDGCTGLEKVTVLCDASVIPAGSFDDCPLVLVAENATGAEIAALNAKLGRGGVTTVRREGDPLPEPVGAEGAPYFGNWYAFDMVVEGQHYDPAAFGAEMRLTLLENGAYEILDMNGDLDGGLWGASADGAQMDGTPITLTEEGWLYIVEEGVEVTFYKEGTEKPITGPQPVGEEGAPYLGEWVLTALVLGDTAVDPAEYGMTMTLTLNEDGTFEILSEGEDPEQGYWFVNENGASLMGIPVTLDAEGFLVAEEDDGQMKFARPRREIGEAGAPYVGKWYMFEMEVQGQHYDPATFGAEIVLTLNEDTTYEIVGFGGATESGEWSVADGVVTAGEMVLSLTEEGYLHLGQDSVSGSLYREGTEKPVTMTAEPVGEAGAPYVGTWNATVIELEGVQFNPSDFGMAMTLTLNEDGTFEMTSGEDPAEHGPWSADENGASLMGMLTLALDENGMLVLEEDSMVMRFAREGGEAPAALDERCLPYAGTWYGIWLESGTNKLDPRKAWGMNIILTLNEDGTGMLDYMGSDGGKRWGWDEESGHVYYGLSETASGAATPLILEEDLLRFGTQYSGFILFSRDPNAVWELPASPAPTAVPTPEPTAVPTVPPTPVYIPPALPTEAPTAVPTAVPTATPAPFDPVGTRLVCSKASSGGFPLEPSMLGGEYAIELRADGKAIFTVAGMKLDPLNWVRSGNDYVVDYFGTELHFVPQDDSLVLDYMGAMLLTFTRP